MTKVTINSQTLSEKFHKETTLSDIINFLTKHKISEEDTITNIYIDNQQAPLNEDDKIYFQALKNYRTINFEVRNKVELAFEALDSCSFILEQTITKINELIEMYRKDAFQKASTIFTEIIDYIDLFTKMINKIYQTINKKFSEKNSIKKESFQELEQDLLFTLKAILEAKEKNDIVMIPDLLEYELIENLGHWDANIISKLKALNP